MRWIVILLVACSAPSPPAKPAPPPPPPPHDAMPVTAVAQPHRPIVLAVLGLEASEPAAAPVAAELTLQLRNRAREDAHVKLTAHRELVDEKLLMSCDTEAPDCMARIGDNLGADYLLYGHVAPGFAVTLQLFDVRTRQVWPWRGVTSAERAAIEAFATGAYGELVAHVPP